MDKQLTIGAHMKIKSVSGLVCYVKDLDKTTAFYESLGFQLKKREANRVTVNINWFWIDFVAIDQEDKPNFQKEVTSENKGAGIYTYISVDDVDEFYEGVVALGYKPSSEPKDWPWGNREFVLRDPDGYKLVIFKRL
jgi:catechol 2,3-dioxygenase-like lactoylglutathione lyase family enzyme